jgi:MFS family permease
MDFRKIKEFFPFEINIVVFAISNVIYLTGFFAYTNFLPKFYEALGASTVIIGLLFTLENGAQQFFHLIGGYWSDRYGRKKIYLVSCLVSIMPLLIFYFAPSWVFLIPAILLVAFSDGVGGTAGSTIIMESVHKRKRATGWSLVQSAGTFAALVAAPFGGFVIDKFGIIPGFRFGLLIALVASVIDIIFMGLFLRETLKRKIKIAKKASVGLMSGIRQMLNFLSKIPHKIKSYFLFVGLLFFGMSLIQPFLIFYALDVIGIGAFEFGVLMAVMTGVSTASSIIGGKISDTKGRKRVLLAGVLMTVLSTLIFLFSKNFAQLILAAVLDGIATMGFSSIIPYVADHVKAGVRAKTLGLTNFILALSSAPAPLIGGWLYALSPSLPFIALVGVGGFTFFVGWKVLA